MKLAIIGSRNLSVGNLDDYIPKNVTEIVSGGARGIDTAASNYTMEHGLKLKVFLPEYERYKRGAPLKRNLLIAEYADECIAFWDGESKGTMHTAECFRKLNKKVVVIKK